MSQPSLSRKGLFIERAFGFDIDHGKSINEIEINRDSSPEHLARDIQHPGIQANRVFGERLAEEFAAQYNFKK